jgi:thiol:disulfide interchange protein DsbD
VLLISALLGTFGAAFAASLPDGAQKLLPPEQAFRLSARALDASTLEARFDVADGYYLYRDKLSFSTNPVAMRGVDLPPGVRKHDEFFGDVETYRGTVVVRLPLAEAAQGRTLTLRADSQGCADVGVCYPPNPQQLKLVVPTAGAGPYVEPAKKGWFN